MESKLIRQLILSGKIKVWSDVYRYTTLTEMSEAFGRSNTHWRNVKDDPLSMSLQDMFKIIEVLKITRNQFYGLVGGQD